MSEYEPRRGETTLSKMTLDFLRAKHEVIKDAYLMEDRVHGQSCGLIALEVARCLRDEGKEAVIMEVSIREPDGAWGIIRPLAYRHRNTEWTSHQVCCYEDLALDPIIGQPVPIAIYAERVFGENIAMNVLVTKDEVQQMLASKDARIAAKARSD